MKNIEIIRNGKKNSNFSLGHWDCEQRMKAKKSTWAILLYVIVSNPTLSTHQKDVQSFWDSSPRRQGGLNELIGRTFN